jgi:hypothetical protein
VSLATNTGKFTFDPDVIGARDIMALIDNLGMSWPTSSSLMTSWAVAHCSIRWIGLVSCS